MDVDGTATGDIGSSITNRKFDLLKNSSAILSQDDPTGVNAVAIPLIYTKNSSTVKYSLRGGVDGYTLEKDKLFDSYDLYSDAETEEVDYIIQGPAMSNVTDSTAKAQNLPRLCSFHRKKQHMQQTEATMAAAALDDETRP